MSDIKFHIPDWLSKLNELTYLKFSVASRKSGGKTYYTLSYAAKGEGLFPKFIDFGGSNLGAIEQLVEQAIKGFKVRTKYAKGKIDPFIGSENITARFYALRNLSSDFPPSLGESAITRIEREKLLEYLSHWA